MEVVLAPDLILVLAILDGPILPALLLYAQVLFAMQMKFVLLPTCVLVSQDTEDLTVPPVSTIVHP